MTDASKLLSKETFERVLDFLEHHKRIAFPEHGTSQAAASVQAHITALESRPTLSDDLEGLVGRLEDFSQGDWSSGQVNDLCAEAASAIRALAGERAEARAKVEAPECK